jgi:uncharacterized protein YbbC (DUF1343 family)
MKSLKIKNRILLLNIAFYSCCFIACLGNKSVDIIDGTAIVSKKVHSEPILVGANQTEKYLQLLQNKRVAVVANQTSVIFKNEQQSQYTHLVDSLLSLGVNIKKVFAPEHGFRGTADAGELIKDGTDTKTGLPIISLYGNNKKPTIKQLDNLDIVIFDIQDVGARFYTYISTLHYVMEACAENGIEVLVFDRPNPNGHYTDGPVLELEHQSFVGMHSVPVVHGMSIGEYAQMINGEGWLNKKMEANLTIIPVANYHKQIPYSLPIKPSPNLPNDTAINLYPSLCFFEGTNVNAGRGTSKQFQVFGSPFLDKSVFEFGYIPKPNEGAKDPKYNGEICYGMDVSDSIRLNEINLDFLIMAYQNTEDASKFFNNFFTKLAGNQILQEQIQSGLSSKAIKQSWQKDLDTFKELRQPYLLYD